MHKDEVIAFFTSRGWTLDRWGHLKSPSGHRRIKLSRIAARYEVKSPAGWVRIKSNYFSRLRITDEGRLAGMAS